VTYKQVLVGADPELFIRDPQTGDFLSAHDNFVGPRIKGTKLAPHPVPHGAVQIDGTALEFNIDPATNVDEFVNYIGSVRRTLTAMVPGYNVVAEPVARFDPDYFKFEVPTSAQELGCNPDYNGWTETVNPRPDPAGEPFRTASGHLHIGWTEGADVEDRDHFLFCCKVARQLDYYLGVYSLLWDKDGTRRKLYGKAGAFRPKSYGLEYRVLSNRWLDSEALMRWVYNTIQCAMADAFAGSWAEDFYGDLARGIIDNNETNWPEEVIEFDLGLEPLPKIA
jgi:Phage phiEco32-like COOH.NH2 ligase-type 2